MPIEKFRKISPQLAENEPMSRHTSFRIGGTADMFVSVKNAEEIKLLTALAKECGIPYMIMGNGSNMLVGDGGIRGLVIQIGHDFAECEVNGTTITAQAGIMMSKLAATALRHSLSGFEELSGIPGTLGGGLFMNAGAYGGEIKDVVKSVTYMDDDGEIYTINNSECEFGYRTSVFAKGGKYILSAELELEPGDAEKIKADMADFNKRRSDKQPLSMPSAGSTFKRPEGYFAGKLIEDAGLRGYSIGGAQVSEKHAGFVVNTGGATAKDVTELISFVKRTVWEKFGVELEPEIKLTGEK